MDMTVRYQKLDELHKKYTKFQVIMEISLIVARVTNPLATFTDFEIDDMFNKIELLLSVI